MPTKDKSQFALINRIRGKTSYFAHLTAQEDLNDGKINRIQSNGGSGSIMSEYGAGFASLTESEIKNLIIKKPPTKPTSLSSNFNSASGITISWEGGIGATSYIYVFNGVAVIPSSSTSQSATFSSGISFNISNILIITAINRGGTISSDPFTFIIYQPLTLNSNYSTSYFNDIFILKYLTDGTPQWAKNIGGAKLERPVNMISDATGNVYVSGYYSSFPLNIPGFTPNTFINYGPNDIFILKYSSNGTPQWAKNIGEFAEEQPVNMVLDTAGNLYVSGHYNSPTLSIPGFTPNALTNLSSNTCIFILKYSANGTPQWAKSIGGTGIELPVNMVLDATGNVYLSGYYDYSTTIDIPGFTPNTLTNSGGNDTFILKYLADGTPQWAKNIGGISDELPVNMVLDTAGNIYLSGYYGSTTLNIPGFTPNTLTRSGSNDIFILKYSANGTPQWAKSIGGTGNDLPVNMLLDIAGNVYLSGYYGSTTLNIPGFTPNTLTRLGTSGNDIFILKYLTDGTPQWAKSIGGTGTEQPVNMVLDTAGNVYLSGFYSSTTFNIPGFAPSTLTRLGISGNDTFILKYLTDGTPQWAKSIGGTGTEQPVNMVLDTGGNLYISGYYASTTLNIPGFTPSSLTKPGTSGNDIFILKYLTDGTPQWAKSIGGTADDRPVNMVLDTGGNVYVSGFYSSLALNIPGFTPNTLTNSSSHTSIDIFITKYTSNGIPQWAKNIGGTADDRPVIMLLDAGGNVYVSGSYSSLILNIPGFTPSNLARSGVSRNDTFILKYLADGTPQWAKSIGGAGNDQLVNMVLDTSGNVYISGFYHLSTTINIPGFTPNILTNYSGSYDIFILKYLTDGTPQWAKSIGETGTEQPVNMVLDTGGNVYVSGFYSSLALNIPGFTPETLTNSGGNDTFILKYLADGTPQWAKSIGGTGTEQPVNMVLDTGGNVYLSGHYDSTTLNIPGFTPNTLTNSSEGFYNIFILKYLADGTPQWAKNIGETGNVRPVNMVLDATGNVYVSGYYNSTTLNIPGFTPSTLTEFGTGENTADIFILKYNSSGTPQWAKNIGGIADDRPVNMVLDAAGNVYITGYFLNILSIENISSLTSSGEKDTFIVKYSANGTLQWAKNIAGIGDDEPVNTACDSSGNLYISGIYASPSLTFT